MYVNVSVRKCACERGAKRPEEAPWIPWSWSHRHLGVPAVGVGSQSWVSWKRPLTAEPSCQHTFAVVIDVDRGIL